MKTLFALLLVGCAGVTPAHADDLLTLDAARQAMGAATAAARRLAAPGGAVAIVDAGGHLLMLERLDGSFPASAAVAIEKARTAAVFRMPTRNLEDAVSKGRTSLVAVDVMLPLRGGVPLVRGGVVVGAVGVSGAASAQQDDEIADAVASAFAAPASAAPMPAPEAVAALVAADVTAAFAAGRPLLENARFKIHASRREAPGLAEVHTRDTDILYVLDGAATLVTGGTVVGGRVTASDEVRGSGIDGGETRRLAKGDVVVVPNGVPHRFTQVQAPFLYYVVKVTAPAAPDHGGSR